MNTDILTIIISSCAGLLAAMIGGALVAVINNLFTKAKTDEETRKLRAETDKITAEADKIRQEAASMSRGFEKLNLAVEEVAQASGIKEKTYFTMATADIASFEVSNHSILGREAEGSPESSLAVKQNTLVIIHTKVAGSYFIKLVQYAMRDRVIDYIPKDETVSGKRRVKIFLEAKTDRGACTLRLSLYSHQPRNLLTHTDFSIQGDKWREIETVLDTSPLEDCTFNISFFGMTEPQTVVIRNLRVSDRSIQ